MKRLIYRVYKILKEHSEGCQFFDQFGLFIQLILGAICLSALIYKRYIEKPQRPWIIWMFDTLKQIIGQSGQHLSNLLIAYKIGSDSGSECEWYLNVLMSDCTLGVLFCYLYLKLLIFILEGTILEFKTGDYGQGEISQEQTEEHPKLKWKCKNVLCQYLWWFLIVTVAKFTTLGILLIFYTFVEKIGHLLLSPIKNDPKLKLIFVMIIFPVFFNILQFWFTDNFIKINSDINDKQANVENNNQDTAIQVEENEKSKGYLPVPSADNNI